jgi:uncharacterized membrane protein
MLLTTILLALLPVSELRAAIPWAVAQGMPLWEAALLRPGALTVTGGVVISALLVRLGVGTVTVAVDLLPWP